MRSQFAVYDILADKLGLILKPLTVGREDADFKSLIQRVGSEHGPCAASLLAEVAPLLTAIVTKRENLQEVRTVDQEGRGPNLHDAASVFVDFFNSDAWANGASHALVLIIGPPNSLLCCHAAIDFHENVGHKKLFGAALQKGFNGALHAAASKHDLVRLLYLIYWVSRLSLSLSLSLGCIRRVPTTKFVADRARTRTTWRPS